MRNKYFKVWSAAAQPQGYPDEIDMIFGNTVESEVTAVENGQGDWVFDPLPSDRLSQLSTKYSSQLHVNPLTAIWYLPMNTNIAPFNNLKARQAVNYAINKNSTVALYGGTQLAAAGVHDPAARVPRPRQLLPVPEGQRLDLRGTGPAKAKQLVNGLGHQGRRRSASWSPMTPSTRPSATTCQRAQLARLQGDPQAAIGRTSSSTTSRTPRTRSRSACRSGTRTTRPPRTS